MQLGYFFADGKTEPCAGLAFRASFPAPMKTLQDLVPLFRRDTDAAVFNLEFHTISPLTSRISGSHNQSASSVRELDGIADQIPCELGDLCQVSLDCRQVCTEIRHYRDAFPGCQYTKALERLIHGEIDVHISLPNGCRARLQPEQIQQRIYESKLIPRASVQEINLFCRFGRDRAPPEKLNGAQERLKRRAHIMGKH